MILELRLSNIFSLLDEVEDTLYLLSSQKDAANRARKLKEFFNPSSTVYRLIDDLESLKEGQGTGME